MEVFSYYLITIFLMFLSGISRLLTIKVRGKFGEFLGLLMMKLTKKRRDIVIKNLTLAFPEKDDNWKNDICRRSFNNLAITLLELLALTKFNKENINTIFNIENIDVYYKAKKQNKGVILLASHYGNWELMAYGAGLALEERLLIIVQPQRNFVADRVLNAVRSFQGNRLVSKYSAAREILKEISSGGVLALLADQSASSDKDVSVNFFGVDTVFYKSPAELALRFKCPVLMGKIIRNEDFTYNLIFEEMEYSDLEYNKDGIQEFTQRYANFLQKIATENPQYWAWQHKKWKHSFSNFY